MKTPEGATTYFNVIVSGSEHLEKGFSGGPIFDPESRPVRVLGILSITRENGKKGTCVSVAGIAQLTPKPNIGLCSSFLPSDDWWFDPQLPHLELPWQEREIEHRLSSKISDAARSNAVRVALVGLGGVGKTRLARRLERVLLFENHTHRSIGEGHPLLNDNARMGATPGRW